MQNWICMPVSPLSLSLFQPEGFGQTSNQFTKPSSDALKGILYHINMMYLKSNLMDGSFPLLYKCEFYTTPQSYDIDVLFTLD